MSRSSSSGICNSSNGWSWEYYFGYLGIWIPWWYIFYLKKFFSSKKMRQILKIEGIFLIVRNAPLIVTFYISVCRILVPCKLGNANITWFFWFPSLTVRFVWAPCNRGVAAARCAASSRTSYTFDLIFPFACGHEFWTKLTRARNGVCSVPSRHGWRAWSCTLTLIYMLVCLLCSLLWSYSLRYNAFWWPESR